MQKIYYRKENGNSMLICPAVRIYALAEFCFACAHHKGNKKDKKGFYINCNYLDSIKTKEERRKALRARLKEIQKELDELDK